MLSNTAINLSTDILKMAQKYGADLAGFVGVESLQHSASYKIQSKLPPYALAQDSDDDAASRKDPSGRVKTVLPQAAQTLLITAISHPEDRPELDYWRYPFPGGTEGNLRLIRINNKIIKWLKEEVGITGVQIPYPIEKGGIYVKDAAVLAGLGVIGKNNLLITPQFGPRVRLRAMALSVQLPTTGPIDFDPCTSCDVRCRRICPQGAFDEKVYSHSDYGQSELPGREGVYARTVCKLEMDKNRDEASLIPIEAGEKMRVTAHCRECEVVCPVGAT